MQQIRKQEAPDCQLFNKLKYVGSKLRARPWIRRCFYLMLCLTPICVKMYLRPKVFKRQWNQIKSFHIIIYLLLRMLWHLAAIYQSRDTQSSSTGDSVMSAPPNWQAVYKSIPWGITQPYIYWTCTSISDGMKGFRPCISKRVGLRVFFPFKVLNQPNKAELLNCLECAQCCV